MIEIYIGGKLVFLNIKAIVTGEKDDSTGDVTLKMFDGSTVNLSSIQWRYVVYVSGVGYVKFNKDVFSSIGGTEADYNSGSIS